MLPQPSATRLARLTVILTQYCSDSRRKVSSKTLSKLSGYSATTIRKDISHLGNPGNNGAGYDASQLLTFIRKHLNLTEPVKAGIAGIGRLGSSLINYPGFSGQGIEIIAGFDSSINKIEQSKSTIPLFPSHEIENETSRQKLELGIIAVPKEEAQKTADRMIAGGIRGILNFSPATLEVPEKVTVRNLYVAEELIALATQIRCNKIRQNK